MYRCAAAPSVLLGFGDARLPMCATSPALVSRRASHCFVVRDGDGEVFAHVYYEQDPVRRAATKLPTKDEAHQTVEEQAACFVVRGCKRGPF
jgi:hypothetical protein